MTENGSSMTGEYAYDVRRGAVVHWTTCDLCGRRIVEHLTTAGGGLQCPRR